MSHKFRYATKSILILWASLVVPSISQGGTITAEDFEATDIPSPLWQPVQLGGTADAVWDDVTVPFARSGDWVIYPGDEGTQSYNPGDPYPGNMTSVMTFGPFSLTNTTSAALDFYYRLDSVMNNDGLIVCAYNDGSVAKQCLILSGSTLTLDDGTPKPLNQHWRSEQVDLDGFVGDANVMVAFIFVSTNVNEGAGDETGVFIDDVNIRTTGDGACPGPTGQQVNILGDVVLGDVDNCALVLANGQHTFSCSPTGEYSLSNVPLDSNGEVTIFGFADGQSTYTKTFAPCGNNIVWDIYMRRERPSNVQWVERTIFDSRF